MSGKAPGLIPAGLRRAGNPGGGGGAGGSVASTDITDATSAGRSMLTAANAAAQRALLSLAAIATSGLSADITDATAAGRALLTAASAALQRTALGLAAIASSGLAADITDATAPGRTLLTAATAALQRTALGLAAIASSGASADITDSTAPGRALLTAATAALQRTALGLAAIASSGASADITDSTAAGRALLTAASVALQRTALGLATVASSGLASDLTGTLGVANGGTGQTTAVAAADALSPMGANIAGGNTTDLATTTGPVVTVTGGAGVTISSFGTLPAGARRLLFFASSGAAIIHNGSALICPFGTSIGVSAGDVYEVTSLGSGTWRVTNYLPVTASAWRTALGLAAMASSAIAANITDASAVGRSMLTAANQAAQTALIALATTSLAGLMSAADKTKLDAQGAVLEIQTLTAQGTLTTSAWTANAYSKITIELNGLANAGVPSNSNISLRANADSSAKYGSTANFHSTANGVSTDVIGTATSAVVAQLNTTTTKHIAGILTIFPKTVSGKMRDGLTQFATFPNSATTGEYYGTEGSFVWSDTSTDWTFVTLLFGSSSTFTGTMTVRGWT